MSPFERYGKKNDRPIRTHHAARILGFSCRTIRHWAQNKLLPAFKEGRKEWRFRRQDVMAFKEQRERRV